MSGDVLVPENNFASEKNRQAGRCRTATLNHGDQSESPPPMAGLVINQEMCSQLIRSAGPQKSCQLRDMAVEIYDQLSHEERGSVFVTETERKHKDLYLACMARSRSAAIAF